MITEFEKLPVDWKERFKEIMGNGGHMVEVMKDLGITYRTHARFMKDHEEYKEAVEEGKLLCEAWWYKTGRDNLKNKKEFDNGMWIFTMKAVFGLRETISLDSKGSALPRKEDEAAILEKYKNGQKEKEAETH